MTVRDHPNLLDALLRDAETASPLWTATAYWRNYTGRIVDEVRRAGLGSVQRNSRILTGYGSGGVPEPKGPVRGLKRAIWNALTRAPLFDRVVAEDRRVIASEHHSRIEIAKRYGHVVADAVAARFPGLRVPPGLSNGEAEDGFEWRGQQVTAAWVFYLARVADFYAVVPPASVTGILELGPGLGLSTLAHWALNPHLRTVVNVDIVPIIYVSTQYLRSTGAFDVHDYLDLRDRPCIGPLAGADRPALYQIPPWRSGARSTISSTPSRSRKWRRKLARIMPATSIGLSQRACRFIPLWPAIRPGQAIKKRRSRWSS